MVENFSMSSSRRFVSKLFLGPFLNPGISLMQGLASCVSEISTLIRRELANEKGRFQDAETNVNSDMKIEKEVGKDATQKQICTMAFLTFILTFFQSWLQHSAKVDTYFLVSLLESTMVLILLHLIRWKEDQIFKTNLFSYQKLRSNLLLIVLQSLTIILMGNYWKQSDINRHCPDFYELFLVLTIPSVIVWMQTSSNYTMSGKSESIIFAVSGVKLLTLCSYPTFKMQISTSLSSAFLSVVNGLFLVTLHSHLKKKRTLALLHSLMLWRIPLIFLLVIFHGELQHFHEISISRQIAFSFQMALVTSVKMLFMFLLIKHANPLTCAVSMNLSWVPMSLVRAFIFKFIFLVTTFKLIWLFILDAVILAFKSKFDYGFEFLLTSV